MNATTAIAVLAVLIGFILGTIGGYYGRRLIYHRRYEAAKHEAERLLEEAKEKERSLLIEAREEALKIRSESEEELKERRSELQRMERRLTNREENADRRAASLDRREKEIARKEKVVDDAKSEIDGLKEQELKRLEEISNLTTEEARKQLIERAEADIKHELAARYLAMEQQAKDESQGKARTILADAIQRLASDVVSEITLTTVPLPSDDMKGRLIGREGRNIRAIEKATGVDLIIDETPEAVTLSCFDPIRREVARIALTKLIADGRIHPARIEEMVVKSEKEVEEAIKKAGEQAVIDVGVRGLNPELVKLLGRLKYRFSYGENVLQHSIEVAHLSGMLASSIGSNTRTAKTAGLLHDIGKALTHEVDGPHAEISAETAAKMGVPDAIVAAIKEHHGDEHTTVESFIIAAADAISAARPGARKDTVEHYIQRLEALEEVGRGFEGVEKCFAIQAGREVRIMVKPQEIDDIAASQMAREIVKKIEETLTYPGQIKVTVVRESRSVEFAR